MPVTPPLDKVPQVPSQLVSVLNDLIVNQINKLSNSVENAAVKTSKLPEETDCNDPLYKNAKESLNQSLEEIQRFQDLLPRIQTIIDAISTTAKLAQAIKAAQLLNPVTAPAVLAAELVIVQNVTIANSVTALEQLKTLPSRLELSINAVSKQLASVVDAQQKACNSTDSSLTATTELINEINNKFNENTESSNINDIDNSTIDSEFYQTKNVSVGDLNDREEKIERLINQQRDLLSSLEDAPSKVYNGNISGTPDSDIGKIGDYFIDTSNNVVYGPKISSDNWGDGVSF